MVPWRLISTENFVDALEMYRMRHQAHAQGREKKRSLFLGDISKKFGTIVPPVLVKIFDEEF